MRPHVVAAVFARGGSKGVPRKNVRLLAGKPLVAYSIEAAKASRLIDRVVVSTDDAEIAQVAERHGAEVPFMRPAELAQDDSPEWLAWQHAIRELEGRDGARRIDLLVSVPPTSPMRAVTDIDACIQMMLQSDADVVVTVRHAQRNPYFNMVTLDETAAARLVIESAAGVFQRQGAPAVYDMTTVAYAARPAFVLGSKGIFDGRVRAVVVPAERALDIDTELDFRFADFLLRQSVR